MLPLPALVAKWQTRTLEVRVEKSMGVRVSPSAHLFGRLKPFRLNLLPSGRVELTKREVATSTD